MSKRGCSRRPENYHGAPSSRARPRSCPQAQVERSGVSAPCLARQHAGFGLGPRQGRSVVAPGAVPGQELAPPRPRPVRTGLCSPARGWGVSSGRSACGRHSRAEARLQELPRTSLSSVKQGKVVPPAADPTPEGVLGTGTGPRRARWTRGGGSPVRRWTACCPGEWSDPDPTLHQKEPQETGSVAECETARSQEDTWELFLGPQRPRVGESRRGVTPSVLREESGVFPFTLGG